MKRLVIWGALAACLAVNSPAFAADTAPAPDPTVKVELSATDAQIITLAVQAASHQCGAGEAAVYCQVGLASGPLLAKVQAAQAQLAEKAKK